MASFQDTLYTLGATGRPAIPRPTNLPVPRSHNDDLAERAALLDAMRDEFDRITSYFWSYVKFPSDIADDRRGCWEWTGKGIDFSFRLENYEKPIRWNPARFAYFATTDKDLKNKVSMICAGRNGGARCCNPNHIRSQEINEGI